MKSFTQPLPMTDRSGMLLRDTMHDIGRAIEKGLPGSFASVKVVHREVAALWRPRLAQDEYRRLEVHQPICRYVLWQ